MSTSGQTLIKMIPRLNGESWMAGANPNLGSLQGNPAGVSCPQECVDHHIYRADDGLWHLWGCVRNTAVGRILYHWRANKITDSPWEPTGEIIRSDRTAGESLDDWQGEEWIQSPYIIKDSGTYHMFFGGHAVGRELDPALLTGDYRRCHCQICRMTSPDGLLWCRLRNKDGRSLVFRGPGEARDPCVLRVRTLWYLYYAGYEWQEEEQPGVYVRISEDLVHWSEYRLVHRWRHNDFGLNNWDTECPHVVYRGGFFYLFRTENYALARTHVFRSADPLDFGIDRLGDYLGVLPVSAPEIIVDGDGQEYITSNHNLTGGTMVCKLIWEQV